MRLIDADELIPLIKMGECNSYDDLCRGRNGGIDFAIERIKQMPTVERKTGKWIPITESIGWEDVTSCECSNCGLSFMLDEWTIDEVKEEMRYCYQCGAKMED